MDHLIERKYVDFIQHNILLISLALGSGLMLIIPHIKKDKSAVSPAEAVTLINRSNALVLDVRDASEFSGGHIAQAKNIPLTELANRLDELKKHQNKAILVHCQRGVRSAKACAILRKAEFTQVTHLQGGLNAWAAAKLPMMSDVSMQKARSQQAANDET